MNGRQTPVGGGLTMQLAGVAAKGVPMPSTAPHSTAQILAMTMEVGGAEKIDPSSLVRRKKLKILPCATI